MPRLKMGDISRIPPLAYKDDIRAYRKDYAEALDAQDPLRHLRKEFIIPTKKDLKRKTLAVSNESMLKDSNRNRTKY
jgi:kynureninase